MVFGKKWSSYLEKKLKMKVNKKRAFLVFLNIVAIIYYLLNPEKHWIINDSIFEGIVFSPFQMRSASSKNADKTWINFWAVWKISKLTFYCFLKKDSFRKKKSIS